MPADYISQFYTWATGNTITAARLNGNISNLTDGLSGGVKSINIGQALVGGTEIITSGRVISNITQLTVDNIDLNGNTISSTTGALNLVPFAGSACVIDGVWSFDANTVTALSGNLNLVPAGGSAVVLDGHFSFDGTVLTAITDNNTTITAYTGKNITIEGVSFDGGIVTAGSWNGTTIAVTYGGTGATTLTGIIKGNGTSAFTTITGTAGYITKWTDSNTIGNSSIYETGGEIFVGDSLTSGRLASGTGEVQTRKEGSNSKFRCQSVGSGIQGYLAFDRARGTFASPTALGNGDVFGSLIGVGAYDSSGTFAHGPEIMLKTSEAWTGTGHGSSMIFYTVPNGSTTQTIAAILGHSSIDLNYSTSINASSGNTLIVNTSNFVVDSTNVRAGIGTASPGKGLEIKDSSNNNTAQLKLRDSSGSVSFGYLGVFSDEMYINCGGTFASGWSSDNANKSISGITLSSGNASSAVNFLTTTTNNASPTNRMTITGAGNIVLGTQSALATNATDGFIHIPTSAGTPTGTPTSYTGKVALQYDTTNNKLYAYNGAWKSVTLA